MAWVRGVLRMGSVVGGFLEESWIDILDGSVFVSELAADMVERRHGRRRSGESYFEEMRKALLMCQ